MPRNMTGLDVREGPPAPWDFEIVAEPAPVYWVLLDTGRKPVCTYFEMQTALDALRYEWPPWEMAVLQKWERNPGVAVMLVEWYLHWDGDELRSTEVGSIPWRDS